ncbi:MAG TPA: hypothetical protein VH392_09975 [Sphingomicrobium sp.]
MAPQPKSARTVAAYEVPVSTTSDRNEFLGLLAQEAKADGFHVDAATEEEIRQLSEVSPITIDAAVWRGKNDDEAIASVMDGADHLGLAWLTFSKSEEPERTAQFRQRLMKQIILRWPKTQTLPIMPTGAIPLHQDLVLTKDGYRVKRGAASKYELPQSSPLATGDTR